MNKFNILCVKQAEKYVFNSVKVKKVKFSMLPSNVIIKTMAHSENLRKINETGLWKERENRILRTITTDSMKGKK